MVELLRTGRVELLSGLFLVMLVFIPSFPSGEGGNAWGRMYLPLLRRPLDPGALSTGEATSAGARTSYAFNQILSCLNTPDFVSQFTHNNITYDAAFAQQACAPLGGVTCYFPSWVIYQQGKDVCRGFAIFQSYILEKNDFDAYMIGLSIESSTFGRNVCGVNTAGKILLLDNGWIEGYFNTLAEIAQHYIVKGIMTPGGTLRTIRASLIDKTVRDGEILALPWEYHSY
jgi:hypothetical protein